MGGRGHTSPCGWSVTGVGSTLVHYSFVSTLLVGVMMMRHCWLVYDNYCWHADKTIIDPMSCCKRLGRKPPKSMPCSLRGHRTGQCYLAESDHVISSSLRRHTIHSLGTQTRHATSLQQPFNLIHCHPQRRGEERGERRERVREPFLNFYTNASLPKPKPSSFMVDGTLSLMSLMNLIIIT